MNPKKTNLQSAYESMHMRCPNQSWPNWVLIIYNDISYDVIFLRTC